MLVVSLQVNPTTFINVMTGVRSRAGDRVVPVGKYRALLLGIYSHGWSHEVFPAAEQPAAFARYKCDICGKRHVSAEAATSAGATARDAACDATAAATASGGVGAGAGAGDGAGAGSAADAASAGIPAPDEEVTVHADHEHSSMSTREWYVHFPHEAEDESVFAWSAYHEHEHHKSLLYWAVLFRVRSER